MDFSTETKVRATRKQHRCSGCRQLIVEGAPAVRWVGNVDGDFGSAVFHPDCRDAEVQFNHDILASTDDWCSLEDAVDDGAEDWLRENYPTVAARMCPQEVSP